jgi:hypothetical protein
MRALCAFVRLRRLSIFAKTALLFWNMEKSWDNDDSADNHLNFSISTWWDNMAIGKPMKEQIHIQWPK